MFLVRKHINLFPYPQRKRKNLNQTFLKIDADIPVSEESFRVPAEETISSSLLARLDELSFEEERILRKITLQRGQGGSIGLQVTEGNDGGVYVQAVSVGGSADMAGNINKGTLFVSFC